MKRKTSDPATLSSYLLISPAAQASINGVSAQFSKAAEKNSGIKRDLIIIKTMIIREHISS
jgi:hypothetical protein